jgi:hypothetical protein
MISQFMRITPALLCLLSASTAAQTVRPMAQREVVRMEPTGAVIELAIDAPTAGAVDVAGTPSRSLDLPGYSHWIEPGRPIVPQKRFLVDVPEGMECSLSTAARDEMLTFSGLRPAPHIVDAESLGLDPSQRHVAAEAAIAGPGFFPAETARIEYVGYFGRRRVASILVTPVRVELPSGAAIAARNLSVRVAFVTSHSTSARNPPLHNPSVHQPPVAPPGHSPSWHTPPQHAGPAFPTAGTASFPAPLWTLKVEVKEKGIYRLTAADLAAAGVPAGIVDPRNLVLYHLGQPVPIRVDGEADGKLDPADRILFYGEPWAGYYTSTNVYFLCQESQPASRLGPAARWRSVDGTVNGSVPTAASFRSAKRAELNIVYWQLMPNGAGKDHWFYKKTIAPSSNAYTLDLADPVNPTGAVSLKVRASLHGYTDTPQNPDHHSRVQLNGTTVSDSLWNGIVPFTHDATVSDTLITGGINTVTVEQVNDTGAAVDGIYTDWVEVEYDRSFISVADELSFSWPGGQAATFQVRKFSVPDILVLDVTNPDEVREVIHGTTSGVPGIYAHKVTVNTPSGAGGLAKYHFAGQNQLKTPASVTKPAARIAPPAAGADWIAIAPESYHSALLPLLQRRAASGLRVAFVSAEQIFDQFGFGIFGPDAIRDFLADAWANWPGPSPASVLLVGDSTIDPQNFLLNNSIICQLPAPLHYTISDGEIPTDHYFACLAGNDPLPELNVGRIPAASVSEVNDAVGKILARETAAPPGAWKTRVSHFSDKGVTFTSALQALAAAHVPSGYVVDNIFADNYASNSAMKTAIINEKNSGNALESYLGHGSYFNWSNYLSYTDIPLLTNTPRLPLSVALNCSNGYYASATTQHGMSETLLLAPLGGAFACYSGSGLGFLSQLIPIAGYCYDRFFAGQNLGMVTTGAKVDAYVLSGVQEDNLWQLILFGDPASPSLP